MGNREEGQTVTSPVEGTTYVRILPNVISWRRITIGESQYQSMDMVKNTTHYGWSSVDTHLIKNSEWGAVAYLCYSVFGIVPQMNGNASSKDNRCYDFHTGAGPIATGEDGRYGEDTDEKWTVESHGYNTANGQLASTTGNVYGIYDMSGGAWERVAAYYDNGHKNLNTYGKSNTHDGVTTDYFTLEGETATISPTYEKYWEAYEVSEEEKNNSITVTGESGPLTQDELWNASKKEDKYEQKRHDLTEETWNKLEEVKGIGINEVAGSWSYRGFVEETKCWKVNIEDTVQTSGRAWNSGFVYVGSADIPFLRRGGYCMVSSTAVIVTSSGNGGEINDAYGFRPVLVF